MTDGTDVVTGGDGGGMPAEVPGREAAPVEEGYEAFKLEQRGIELIPDADRKMRPSGLFWMWAGAIWNVEFLVYGALIVSFGLSFWQAVLAILVGNTVYAFLGWASLPGPETGTTAFMVSRAPFGRNGNRAPSLFNWITQVGFEIEGIVIIVLIIEAMFHREGTILDTGAKVVVIIVAVAVQFMVPFLGHATITKVLRYLSFVFIVVFAIMAALVIPHAHLSSLHGSTPRGGSGRRGWCSSFPPAGSAGPRTPPTTRATFPGTPPRRRPSGPRRSEGRSPRSCSSSSERLPTS